MRFGVALVAVIGLVALAAAGASLGAVESGPTRPAKAISSAPPSTTPPATIPSPTSTTPTPTTIPSPTTTTGSLAGFSPVSVTFVSAETGWVLGTVPGGTGVKLAIAHTTDGGNTWSRSPAPDISFGNGGSPSQIAFADPMDGWITAALPTGPATPFSSALWSTHDGGARWEQVAVPDDGTVTALDASSGVFQMAELATIGTGPYSVHLYSSVATSDTWTRSATRLLLGAGGIPYAQLTLQGEGGWAIEIDRTVAGGARLTSGTWEPWTPPCRHSLGTGSLAASSATDIVALCNEGVWGPPPAGMTQGPWLFTSSDGGTNFVTVGAAPTAGSYSIATPPGEPQVIVVGGFGLMASFDGGQTWKTVYPATTGIIRIVGFTNATQGFAIVTGLTNVSTLLITRDGGAVWSPVDLSGAAAS